MNANDKYQIARNALLAQRRANVAGLLALHGRRRQPSILSRLLSLLRKALGNGEASALGLV